ncbi:MAG: AAA family ATPase [Eubacteriales bacterium]
MERILIIGGNGCGKTTLARTLAHTLNLPLVHLDKLYWRDNWQAVSHDDFDEQLRLELAKPKWIIDGNIAHTLPQRIKYCDTVIYMDFPRRSCIYGSLKRILQNYGKSRPDMGGFCPERFDRGKIKYLKDIWRFNKRNRKRFYGIIEGADGINKVILISRRQVNNFLKTL